MKIVTNSQHVAGKILWRVEIENFDPKSESVVSSIIFETADEKLIPIFISSQAFVTIIHLDESKITEYYHNNLLKLEAKITALEQANLDNACYSEKKTKSKK
jgi:hypothetical protein